MFNIPLISCLIVLSLPGVLLILCPNRRWTLISDGDLEYCLKISLSNQTSDWRTARQSCRKEDAFLLKVDLASTIVYSFEGALGMSSYWTGLHIQPRTGRLIWDELNPLPAEDFGIGSGVTWGNNPHPELGRCVSVQGNGMIESEVLLTANLNNCSEKKQFICQHPGIQPNVTQGYTCYQDWYGNVYSDFCYQLNPTVRETKTRANSFCNLAAPKTYLEYKFVEEYLISGISTSTRDLTINEYWTSLTFDPESNLLKWTDGSNVNMFPGLPTLPPTVTDATATGNCAILQVMESDTGGIEVKWAWRNCTHYTASTLCQDKGPRELNLTTSAPTIELNITNFKSSGSLNEYGQEIPIELVIPRTGNAVTFSLNLSSNYPDATAFYHNWEFTPALIGLPHELQGFYWNEVWRLHPLSKKTTTKLLLIDSETLTYRCEMNVSLNIKVDHHVLAHYNFYGVIQPSLQRLFGIVNGALRGYLTEGLSKTVYTSIRRFRLTNSTTWFVLFDVYIDYNETVSTMDELREMEALNQAFNVSLSQILTDIPRLTDIPNIPNIPRLIPHVKVLPTRKCFSQTINGTTLPSGVPGQIYHSPQLCAETMMPLFVAVCSGNFLSGLEWKVTMEICRSIATLTPPNFSTDKPSSIHRDLKNLMMRELNEDTVNDIAQSLYMFSSRTSQLDGEAVTQVTEIIERIVNQPALNTIAGGQMCRAIDNVLRVDTNMLKVSQKMNSTSTRLLQSLNKYTDIATLESETILQPYESFAVEMWDLTSGINVTGIKFLQEPDSQTSGSRFNNETLESITASNYEQLVGEEGKDLQGINVAIYLPPSLITRKLPGVSESGDDLRLSFIIYRDTTLFKDSSDTNRSLLNGSVISATLGNETIQDLPEEERIRTVFYSNEMLPGDKPVCVYWDFSMNTGRGAWSEKGCQLINSTRNDGYYECSCDHLTNFAVLVDYGGRLDDVNNEVLTYITIIGLSLSIIGLTLTVLTFILFRKARKGNNQKTLFHLALSLLIACVLFLVGIILSQENLHDKLGCQIVAVLLHYFLLASFMWMLMESVLHYLSFVKVFDTYIPSFIIKASIAAWGVPLIPVIVILSVNHNLYYRATDKDVTTFCWMDQYTSYFAFLLPIGVIILLNTVIFIRIVWAITHRPKGLQSNQSKSKQHMISLQAAIACFILLGLTWIFGFLAIQNARLVFQYIFTILNSFQGFFIFLIFTLRDEKVRQYWRSLCCKEDRKSLYTSSASYSNKRFSDDSSMTGTALSESNINGHPKFTRIET